MSLEADFQKFYEKNNAAAGSNTSLHNGVGRIMNIKTNFKIR